MAPTHVLSWMWRLSLVLLLAAAALLQVSAAKAETIYTETQNATRIFVGTVALTNGQPVTIETLSLSTGSDTVLHLQRYPQGDFLAGDDDSGVGHGSRIVYTPSYSGLAWVVVRAYSAGTAGTCTVRVQQGGSTTDYNSQGFGGITRNLNFTAAANVQTVRRQAQADDTVLLLLLTPEGAVAFDDDDGVGNHAFIQHLTPGFVTVVVGTFGGSHTTPQQTTLVVDDQVVNYDQDGDGLGASLEGLLGTSASSPDTDGDGIWDGLEVLGKSSDDLQNYPYYGARATTPDVFFEVDWVNPFGKFTGVQAEGVAAAWADAGVTAHFDIGVHNTTPGTREVWNSWGGATAVTGVTHCTGLSPSRANRFHHILRMNPDGWGTFWGGNGTPCYAGDANIELAVHETGHFRLSHSGPTDNSALDCNPFYRSTMNYGYLNAWPPRYSTGGGTSVANPHQGMSESGWAGQPWLAAVAQWPWNFNVDQSNGRVDWNRNGQFDLANVRAAPTWGRNNCDASGFARNEWGGVCAPTEPNPLPTCNGHFAADPTLAWLEDPSWSDGSQLFLIGRSVTDGNFPRFARASKYAMSYCDAWSDRWEACAGFWSFERIPNSVPMKGGAAAVDIGAKRLLVIYRDTADKLRWQVATSGANFTLSWTNPSYVSSSWVAWTDPAAILDGSLARMYVSGTDFRMVEWRFNVASMSWSGPSVQHWANVAGDVFHGWGTALARGFTASDSTSSIFAVIPGVPDFVNGTGESELSFAKYVGNDHWYLYENFFDSVDMPAYGRPALAYVSPFGTAYDGRFYVAARNLNTAINSTSPVIALSEGNDVYALALKKRLRIFMPPVYPINEWSNIPADGSRATALLFQYGLDKNLRMSYARGLASDPITMFLPLADGVVNKQIKDWNDHTRIVDSLDCGLTQSCTPGPW